ncbi:MAG: hypothetical protein LZ167_06545 [Thaumarchaeota archaeon]|nr:hypothetical protein [Candidatus Geocrenenecus arthurdayi]
MIRETLSIVALFTFFLLVLVLVVGLAYYLQEFGASAVRHFFGVASIKLPNSMLYP